MDFSYRWNIPQEKLLKAEGKFICFKNRKQEGEKAICRVSEWNQTIEGKKKKAGAHYRGGCCNIVSCTHLFSPLCHLRCNHECAHAYHLSITWVRFQALTGPGVCCTGTNGAASAIPQNELFSWAKRARSDKRRSDELLKVRSRRPLNVMWQKVAWRIGCALFSYQRRDRFHGQKHKQMEVCDALCMAKRSPVSSKLCSVTPCFRSPNWWFSRPHLSQSR